MAAIDPDLDTLSDPDFQTGFVIKRRADAVSDKGRTTPTTVATITAYGVVSAASANDLQRLDDEQRMRRVMSIVTRFQLRGPTPGAQPDLVVLLGNNYVVADLQPYPQYGDGWFQALVASMDHIDAQYLPPAAVIGRVDFTTQRQSAWIPIGARPCV